VTSAHRILVVEDDEDIRETLVDLLAMHGYEAVGASNGRDALDRLSAAVPELPCIILLDLMMPVMNGWQFRAAQRADPRLSQIPVVVITAHRDTTGAEAGLDPTARLAKPVDLDEMLRVIREHCRNGAAPSGEGTSS
jgi:CheY-like chemotaxis protein